MSQLPSALAAQTRFFRLGPHAVPAQVAHPDWASPRPCVFWLHGRTADKSLDTGRYLRLLRAGIASCAIDLPGHGERLIPDFHTPARTLELLTQTIREIDSVVDALTDPAHLVDPDIDGLFDAERLALAGMSAGGMATLRRLCDPHRFRCAAVESTSGNLGLLYAGAASGAAPDATRVLPRHPPERSDPLDPIRHLDTWRPLPLLALHSMIDRIVPVECISTFTDALRARYRQLEADPELVRLVTWPETGAPEEHSGFGRVAAEAKTLFTSFMTRHLLDQPV